MIAICTFYVPPTELATCIVVVLQSTLALAEEVARAWITPLELAACIHLATSATTAPLLQSVLAMLVLLLAGMDWHVPDQVACRILTAFVMSALLPSWFVMALLIPTFGKRAYSAKAGASKRPNRNAAPTAPDVEFS